VGIARKFRVSYAGATYHVVFRDNNRPPSAIHYGLAVQEAAEERAERLVIEERARMGWSNTLFSWSKIAPCGAIQSH
jgi:hypothetical protein